MTYYPAPSRNLPRYRRKLPAQPVLQVGKDGFGFSLPGGSTLVWWRTTRFFLNGVELADPQDGFFGDA